MDEKEQFRRELYELAKREGLDVHHKAGIEKLQQALVDAGVPFEPYNDMATAALDPEDEAYEAPQVLGAITTDDDVMDDKDVIAEMRDKLSQIELTSKNQDEINAAREQVAAAMGALDRKVARRKAQAVRKSERVQCVATAKFHVQRTDLGEADPNGGSVKVAIGQQMMLPKDKAVGLEARGQVRIVS